MNSPLRFAILGVGVFSFFFFTPATGLRRSLSLKLSDTRVYEPIFAVGFVRR